MKFMRLLVLLLILSIALTVSGCIKYKKYEYTPEEILKGALEKYNSTSYEVTIISYIVSKDKSSENYQKKIECGIFKGSKFKIESNSSIVVSNGSVMWVYRNDTKNMVIGDFSKSDEKPKEGFTKLLLDLLDNYKLNLRITPDYYIINGTSKAKYHPIRLKTVWIDKRTLMPLKVESNYEFDKLNLTYVTEYKNLKFEEFDDSIFNVTPPKAQVVMRSYYFQKIEDVQKKVNFTIIEPTYTAGYKLKGINAIKQSGMSCVVLYYQRHYQKKCFLLIFESPTYELIEGEEINILGVQAWYKKWEFGGKVKFTLNNITIKIMSDCLSKQKLIAIANSLISQKYELTNS
ncbi:hypothetical protein DRO97_06130 [Archaeoglobales archaeon]|nr:MAG: hypothetical protein DRO97_06130 [Archaeoglobales archaeon]